MLDDFLRGYIHEVLLVEPGRLMLWLYYRGKVKYKNLSDHSLNWVLSLLFWILVSFIIYIIAVFVIKI